jgi:hypothetical protein
MWLTHIDDRTLNYLVISLITLGLWLFRSR